MINSDFHIHRFYFIFQSCKLSFYSVGILQGLFCFLWTWYFFETEEYCSLFFVKISSTYLTVHVKFCTWIPCIFWHFIPTTVFILTSKWHIQFKRPSGGIIKLPVHCSQQTYDSVCQVFRGFFWWKTLGII